LIIGSPLAIQIKGNKKTTKMNDNINMDMDSTIAGSASLSVDIKSMLEFLFSPNTTNVW
jgi:hypothetical protein